jgi:chromosomal replication initiation ATPase DnaA
MNISLTFNGINIDVSINSGVNILSGDSGTGKTLLMQAVELYCLQNDIKYTFLNYRCNGKNDEQIEALCKNSDLILIDNADLFINEELLSKLRDSSKYILMSLKYITKIDDTDATEFLVHYDNLKLQLEEI